MSSISKHSVFSLGLVLAIAAPAFAATEGDKKALSVEEITAKRREVRQELMLPSLTGIKGIAYRVVGYKDFEPLDKLLGEKLGRLGISTQACLKLDEKATPFDAMLQVTFNRLGNATVAELTVTQWVKLTRDPKVEVRAITYKNKSFHAGSNPKKAVEELADEFVIDFLKANQKDFGATGKSGSQKSSGKK